MVSPGALLATNTSGLMAYIHDGDRIAIDILNHKIELLGSEEEIAARKAACAPQPFRQVSGYLKRYRAIVTSANRSADLELDGWQKLHPSQMWNAHTATAAFLRHEPLPCTHKLCQRRDVP